LGGVGVVNIPIRNTTTTTTAANLTDPSPNGIWITHPRTKKNPHTTIPAQIPITKATANLLAIVVLRERYIAHFGHRFQWMSDSDFGASRTPVSLDVGHLSRGEEEKPLVEFRCAGVREAIGVAGKRIPTALD
jgi:hypothetical protein